MIFTAGINWGHRFGRSQGSWMNSTKVLNREQ